MRPLILMLSALPCFGAYAIVSNVAAGAGSANTVTTGAINTTGATLLVMGTSQCSLATCSGVLGAPTDSKGNTWTPLTTQTQGGAVSKIYYSKNPTVGASHTFTFAGTSIFPSISVAAFSGADITSPFDQQSGGVQASSTTSATGNITPLNTSELWVSSSCQGAAQTTVVPGNGTAPASSSINYSAGVHFGVALSYKIQTSIVTEQETWTYSAAIPSAVTIASFKAAAVAATARHQLISR